MSRLREHSGSGTRNPYAIGVNSAIPTQRLSLVAGNACQARPVCQIILGKGIRVSDRFRKEIGNGTCSVIAGLYEDAPALGERWNGERGEPGFPSQGGNPLWHVVPRFLELSILTGILVEPSGEPYTDARTHAQAARQELDRRCRTA